MIPKVANNRSKKPSGKPKRDRNKHPAWGVRIPMTYRRQLAKAAENGRRNLTEQLKIAIEEHLAKQDLWPPD